MNQAVGQVLHLCSDYARQRLYRSLVLSLQRTGWTQLVHVPVRTAEEVGRFDVPDQFGVEIRYAHILRRRHRLLFRTKIRQVVRELGNTGFLARADVVHAHFLYSDGAVALELHRRHGTPFLVAVRNTDLNAFMRWRPDLSHIAHAVLEAAERVVFLSPAYAEALRTRLPPRLASLVASKSLVIPNGLDERWFEPPPWRRVSDSPLAKSLRVLYVGDFSRNKNVVRLIEAVAELRTRVDASLTIVGGGGDGEKEVTATLAEKGTDFTYLGRIHDQERLRALYRSHDVFAMPSLKETFGLVYIEALSQGVPVIHSEGQGIDGYFPGQGISEPVNPLEVASIAAAIERLGARRADLRERCFRAAKRFSWRRIADRYATEYERIARSHGRSQS